jgi:Mrp family chromosome partitioning ATPase
MGRMLDALKQIDQKRGRSDTAGPTVPQSPDPYTTQPLPSREEVAAAEAPREEPPLEDPPAEGLPPQAAGVLTGEEIRALAGGEAAIPRTVDELEREMQELEDLLTLERQSDRELMLGGDPIGAHQTRRRTTEVFHHPASGGESAEAPFSESPAPADEPPAAASTAPTPPSPPEADPPAFGDPETDLMHFELMEQALRGERDSLAQETPFAVFPPALEELAAEPETVTPLAPASASQELAILEPAAAPADEGPAPAVAHVAPSPAHWTFLETPLSREDHDRFARQIVDQLPRRLPASLMLAAAGRQNGRLLALCGLARALAERDEGNVLLIDADLASREITRRLGLARAPGWSDAVATPTAAPGLVVPTDFAGLAVLPAGRGKAGGRLTPESARALLADLKRNHRFVIAEAGGTAATSDVLAQVCDAVYLLVELGLTGREDARRATRRLKQRGASLRGCVLTGLSPSEAALFRPSALALQR